MRGRSIEPMWRLDHMHYSNGLCFMNKAGRPRLGEASDYRRRLSIFNNAIAAALGSPLLSLRFSNTPAKVAFDGTQ